MFLIIAKKIYIYLLYLGLIVEGSGAGVSAENVAVNGPASRLE